MEQEKQTPNYYAVITADVRYANIPANAKLLYGEITALSNKEGFAWASNAYFAKLYGVEVRTIQNWIKALAEGGFISTEINPSEGNTRKIYLAKKSSPPSEKKFTTPHEKKFTHNNTRVNTTKNITNSNELVSDKSQKPTFADGKIDKRDQNTQTLIEAWKNAGLIDPPSQQWHRRYAFNLQRKFGVDVVIRVLPIVVKSYGDRYAPKIANYKDLWDKWADLGIWINKKQATANEGKVATLDGGFTTEARSDIIETDETIYKVVDI